METGEQQGSKRARVEPPVVSIDTAKFQCPICTHPLKPPIFQCGAGHLACGGCHGQLADKDRCYKQGCAQTGGYSRNLPLEGVLHTIKFACPFSLFGCFSFMALYEKGEHEAKCPHRPCCCPKVGCAFMGSLAMVGKHLSDTHSWSARTFDYGKVFRLELLESMRQLLLLAKEDRQVFVVVMGSLPEPGAAYRGVSLLCLRRSAAALTSPPHYKCKVSAEGILAAATGEVPNLSVEMEVPSCMEPPRLLSAAKAALLLVVDPKMLHGPSKELHLLVAINKVERQT